VFVVSTADKFIVEDKEHCTTELTSTITLTVKLSVVYFNHSLYSESTVLHFTRHEASCLVKCSLVKCSTVTMSLLCYEHMQLYCTTNLLRVRNNHSWRLHAMTAASAQTEVTQKSLTLIDRESCCCMRTHEREEKEHYTQYSDSPIKV
jgi:hypothetical protein